MPASESRVEYTRRFRQVVEYIDRHLDEPLDLATLAGVARFSPFHFHRLFAAWMGETPGDYLRRRRLELAATWLVAQPRVPILSIALSVGFASSEAFAHAFKNRFGVSASGWRRAQASLRATHRNMDQGNRKGRQAPDAASGDDLDIVYSPESDMSVELIDRTAVRVVYLAYAGPFGKPLADFWQRRVMPWIVARKLQERAMYGISRDDPSITAADRCRCDIGVEVGDDFIAIGDEQITTIASGRYASMRFFGTACDIQAAWEGLMRDWLPASGLQVDARPMFEHYGPDMRHDASTGAFECDLMIPVMPL